MRRPGDPCERSPRSGRLRNWFRTRFYFSIFSRERRSTTPKYPSVWAGEMAASDEGDGTGRSDGREVPKRRTTPWAPHLGRPEILKSKTWSEGLPVGAVGWDPGAKWPRMAECGPSRQVPDHVSIFSIRGCPGRGSRRRGARFGTFPPSPRPTVPRSSRPVIPRAHVLKAFGTANHHSRENIEN